MTAETQNNSWLSHLPVQRKVLLTFGLMFLLVVANGLAFFYVQKQQRESREWTIHTYEVLDELDDLLVQALNQQTGLRGFLLTNEDRYLDPYRKGEQGFAAALAALRELTRDNALQTPRLDRAVAAMQNYQTQVAGPAIALMQSPDTVPQARALVARGKEFFDELREAVDQMRATERQLLAERAAALDAVVRLAFLLNGFSLLGGLFLVYFSVRLLRQQVTDPLVQLTGLMTRLSDNDHAIVVPNASRRDEIGQLAKALQVFKTMVIDIQQRNWVKTNAAIVASRLQAAETLPALGEGLTATLAPLLESGVAALYVVAEDGETLQLCGSYGRHRSQPAKLRRGEGLVGQCAAQGKPLQLDSLPADYVRISSGTGEAAPSMLVLMPVLAREQVLAVLEFGSFAPFSVVQQALLDELMPIISLALQNLQRAIRTRDLLEESQSLTEELQASTEELRVQQEELRTTNESLHAKSQLLEEQSARLMASEEELRVQSDELQASNEELRQRGEILAEQKKTLEALQLETQQKADELARASQYKSEFLANMSHELRTPLNSLLILSRGLAENEEGHLSADEVESATVIHESGSNLLRLINDILDLSKVEAGKMELVLEPLPLAALSTSLIRNFRHVARERGLTFEVELAADLPESIETDGAKLDQILNNLVSNALKFTREGSVTVRIARAAGQGARAGDIAIQVIDTGIGIAKDKFEKVFQAFEQVDGSTSRQFGGTGLGLSIARGMAQLLGGDIRIDSTEGVGTTFTLALPEKHGQPRPPVPVDEAQAPAALAFAPALAPVLARAPAPVTSPRPARSAAPAFEIADDRELLKAGDTVILIVEDDPAFARILVDLVRRKGYRALFAGDGEAGLALATQYRPTGILLDVMLPGMDGFSVIEALKLNLATRHIPVHFISATEDHTRGLDLGAVGFLTKPVTREALGTAFERLLHFAEGSMRQVLVVDDDPASRLAVRKLVGGSQVQISEAASGREALTALGQQAFDCVILDLGMPDMNGFEFLERAAALGPVPPVVVYSGRDLSPEETLKLRQYTDSIVIKGARSPERLLDEVSLFLHSIREAPTAPKRETDSGLTGRTVLVVDDDMRNIFALSKALRAKGLTVVMAQDGPKAIKQVEENRAIELVLMDIMMPGMDGYQTMGAIRKSPENAKLPIIAVTAKAMRGDREKCLEAGANDYLSKPIDLDKLFSLLRVWLPAR